MAWVVAAFGEEIVFRGALLPRLASALGGNGRAWAAAFGTVAIGFGLAHFYQGPAGMIGTAVAGIIFGLLRRQRVDGLWPAVLAHGVYDTYGLTNVYLGNVG
jgi:membrane protease YdiL (CAAX protease family)